MVFIPSLSKGSEEDILKVPNIPLLAAFAKAQDLDFARNLAFQGILASSGPKEFNDLTVDNFLFGYSDNFISMMPDIDPKKVGLMAGRRGSVFLWLKKLT